jgi:hypothetical protein
LLFVAALVLIIFKTVLLYLPVEFAFEGSIEQDRQLRMLVAEGVGVAEISRVMGKTLVSVRSKMYHLGLSVVDAAAVSPTIAVSVASIASVASTPKPIIDHAPLDHVPLSGSN